MLLKLILFIPSQIGRFLQDLARFLQDKRPDLASCKINVVWKSLAKFCKINAICKNLARSYKITVGVRLVMLKMKSVLRTVCFFPGKFVRCTFKRGVAALFETLLVLSLNQLDKYRIRKNC